MADEVREPNQDSLPDDEQHHLPAQCASPPAEGEELPLPAQLSSWLGTELPEFPWMSESVSPPPPIEGTEVLTPAGPTCPQLPAREEAAFPLAIAAGDLNSLAECQTAGSLPNVEASLDSSTDMPAQVFDGSQPGPAAEQPAKLTSESDSPLSAPATEEAADQVVFPS